MVSSADTAMERIQPKATPSSTSANVQAQSNLATTTVSKIGLLPGQTPEPQIASNTSSTI